MFKIDFRSKLLKQCVTLSDKEDSGMFPDLTKDLAFFDVSTLLFTDWVWSHISAGQSCFFEA